MQQFIRERDVVQYEELLSWNIETGNETEYELFYVEADREPYEEAIASVASIRWYRITEIDDESFYVYLCQETRPEDKTWREAYTTLDLVVLPPIIYDSDASFEMTLVGAGDDLRTLLETLPDDLEVTVDAIGEFDRRHKTIATDCTERQFEALQVAVETGYYDVPRNGTLADVAYELDCAEGTASHLLRQGEAAVIKRLTQRYRATSRCGG
ncbi:helix-turn-helix domain-containing protein [Salinadaptatus halalkaliphilus]